MKPDDDGMPIVAWHRNVGLHAFQGPARLATVRAAIDHVYTLDDPQVLAQYAGDASHPPEARLFAADRCEACLEMAVEAREKRPAVDLLKLHASIVGLDSLKDADRDTYSSIFDVRPPGPEFRALRETPLERD